MSMVRVDSRAMFSSSSFDTSMYVSVNVVILEAIVGG
jgi:hypothetical protein